MQQLENQRVQDPHLDAPSEANREKHINFPEEEEKSAGRSSNQNKDNFSKERKKEWQEGMREGEKEQNAAQERQ